MRVRHKSASPQITSRLCIAAGKLKEHKSKDSQQHIRGTLHCSPKGPSLYCLWGTISETQAAQTKASRVKCFSTSRKRTALAADRWFAAFRIQRRGVPAASAHYCAAAVVVPHRQYRLGPNR